MIPWFHRARIIAVAMLMLDCLLATAAAAQARIGVTATTQAFRGATTATSPGDTVAALRPAWSHAFGISGSYQRGRWRIRLGLDFSTPGASASQGGIQFSDLTSLDLIVLEPTVARRLFTTSEGAAAWLEAGVSADYWLPYTEANRTLVGGTAALVWTQRATRHLDLSVRLHGSASPSPFEQRDLPPELKPATLWRWGVTLELARRL